ncbi:MAG: NfeD family protein [Rhodoferax sp.]
MADSTLWWLAAIALTAVEMLLGTIYLLMLALGLAAAAVSAHLGAGVALQWSVAALVGASAAALWWGLRGRHKASSSADPAAVHDNFDIGARVTVSHWRADGRCHVKYRGAQWEARLAPGHSPQAGAHTVVDIDGNQLVLAPEPPPNPQP